MFKIYQTYLVKKFMVKFFYIFLFFFFFSILLGIFEELSFFKEVNTHILFPYFLTILNTPITLFEIFPFILLLSTQFFFYDIFKNDELDLLKKNGQKNTAIIKLLFLISFFIGLFNVIFYYNFAAQLKFHYTHIKNGLSNDNKYLAVVNESGVWIKDEIDNKILIIKSKKKEGKILIDTVINEFDKEFNLTKIIQSKKIDIENKEWILYSHNIIEENITKKFSSPAKFKTNFNEKTINSLFSNLSTLNIISLYKLKKNYKNLGYSETEITIYLYKLFVTPIFYGIIIILSSIIMFKFTKNKPLIFNIFTGIVLSVLIYYMNFIINSLGINGKISIKMSVFFPILIIFLISLIGMTRVNEK